MLSLANWTKIKISQYHWTIITYKCKTRVFDCKSFKRKIICHLKCSRTIINYSDHCFVKCCHLKSTVTQKISLTQLYNKPNYWIIDITRKGHITYLYWCKKVFARTAQDLATYDYSLMKTMRNKEYSYFCSKQKGINQWRICACILNFKIYLWSFKLTQSY